MLKFSLRAMILLPVLFLFTTAYQRAERVAAMSQIAVELDCPSGDQRAVFPGSVTINPATGAQRYNFCIVAATGHMVYQGDGGGGGGGTTNTIASGTATLNTGAIGGNSCDTVVTPAATG